MKLSNLKLELHWFTPVGVPSAQIKQQNYITKEADLPGYFVNYRAKTYDSYELSKLTNSGQHRTLG